MAKRLDGKVAVISGAAAGIGQASAVRLAEEGARIVIADREDAGKTLQLIKSAGGKAQAIRCDVSDPESVAGLQRQVEQGAGRCDILVNNAGIYPMQSFDEITFDDWRRVFSVNLDSMFLMTKAFVGFMRERRWGRIINIASDTVGLVVPGFTHYIASKAGVIGPHARFGDGVRRGRNHRKRDRARTDANPGHGKPENDSGRDAAGDVLRIRGEYAGDQARGNRCRSRRRRGLSRQRRRRLCHGTDHLRQWRLGPRLTGGPLPHAQEPSPRRWFRASFT
jgi:NADP-dependent 3-hydroxy acid dehydrogenase YdfG